MFVDLPKTFCSLSIYYGENFSENCLSIGEFVNIMAYSTLPPAKKKKISVLEKQQMSVQ